MSFTAFILFGHICLAVPEDFDMHVDAIKGMNLTNAIGTVVYPFSTTIATQLVYDELAERREQSNGDKWHN